MARDTNREPGRTRQIIDVFKRTIEIDRPSLWWILLALIAPTAAGITMAIVAPGGVLGAILYVLLGVTFGFLIAMIVLGRRAEKAAYVSLDGRPGAVGAVLRVPLRRAFKGSEEPVAINPRSFTAVYRLVGAPGVVLIGEGNRTEAQHLLEAERKRVAKAANNVPIHAIWVTNDGKGTALKDVVKTMNKMKRTLSRGEIRIVHARLSALTNALPIPKGIDPRKMRAQRR